MLHFLTLLAVNLSDLPAPYNSIQTLLPFTDQNWYNNRMEIEALAKTKKPKVIIELGSWTGHSTIHLAELVGKTGKVYAVDHFLGEPYYNNDVKAGEILPSLYEHFLSNVIHRKKTDIIIPIRNTTSEALTYFLENNIKPDLIYVDAAHDEENVYNDISLYFPLVKGHGVMCGDDYSWGDLGVQRAVKRFAKENSLRIEVQRNWFWILRE